jgi:hypothetical protein
MSARSAGRVISSSTTFHATAPLPSRSSRCRAPRPALSAQRPAHPRRGQGAAARGGGGCV